MQRGKSVAEHMRFAIQLADIRTSKLPFHMDKSELRSEALYGLVKALKQFDPSRGVPFQAFARFFIVGTMKDFNAANKNQPFAPGGDEVLMPWVEPNILLRRMLERSMDELSAKERETLALRYWSDLTQEETAAVLKLTPGRIGQLERRAIAKMRDNLKSKGFERLDQLL
jgi:RNA polymerase sigma factor (sigma-70 family)